MYDSDDDYSLKPGVSYSNIFHGPQIHHTRSLQHSMEMCISTEMHDNFWLCCYIYIVSQQHQSCWPAKCLFESPAFRHDESLIVFISFRYNPEATYLHREEVETEIFWGKTKIFKTKQDFLFNLRKTQQISFQMCLLNSFLKGY